MFSNEYLSSFSSKLLNLIILPTEDCNFRCSYCYEKHIKGIMSKNIINRIKLFLSQTLPRLEYLQIEWFGGEPLLAIHVIKDISKHIITQNINNTKISQSITTNGYLLSKSMFKDLLSNGINDYQITLDGPPDIHNETRLDHNGKGTFKIIWDNLMMMKNSNHDFSVSLRIHVDESKQLHLENLLKMIEDNFFNDKRFSIMIKEISKLGGKNDSLIKKISPSHFYKLKKLIAQHHSKLRFTNNKNICYACKPNSFIIRPTGLISKCTVYLYDEYNHIGYINKNGKLDIDNDKLMNWINVLLKHPNINQVCPKKLMDS